MREEDKVDKKEPDTVENDSKKPNVFDNKKPTAGVYMNNIVRVGAMIFFVMIIIYDKLLHQFNPPLPEHYYGYAVGVMLFGDKIVDIITQLRK